jgi:putative MATE family efflux protein
LGVKELASVGNAGIIVQILITLSGGLEMGSEVIFAKYIGAKKYKEILAGVKSILLFGLVSGLFITVIAVWLQTPILSLINVPSELSSDTGIYMNIYIIGLAGIFLYDISRAIIIALGDAKCAMLLVLLTSLLNVFLDLFLICILHMGVGGAALATIFSQLIGMAIALIVLRKKLRPYIFEYKSTAFDLGKIKEILSVSIPSTAQQTFLSLSSIFLLTLVNPFGSEVISGYVAVNQIMLFGMLVVIGISQTLSIFTASNSGAGKINRIREGYLLCILFSTGYLFCVIVSNFIIPKYLIGAFLDISNNQIAYQFAKNYLQFSSITYIFYGCKIINESVLRGFMRMREYLYSNLSDLITKIIMTYLLVAQFSLPGFWIGNMLGKIVAFVISMIIISREHLLKKDLGLLSRK